MTESNLIQSDLPKANFLARMGKTTRKVLERFLAALCIFLILLQLYLVRQSVIDSGEAINPPVIFPHDWIPDRAEYYPGDTIRLKYTRITKFDSEKGPLLLYSLDAFENKTNGEIFPGVIIGRIIDAPGKVERTAVRHVPNEATPGEYIFEGWMQAQTSRRSLPVAYESERFTIKAK